ncbi:MAG: DsbA family oxidoreductase [Salinibacter sp.]|uniref:DsbA family oxidoreductase n=1 Tax=Salinibacter sp. TaxID=2065818 RepID=UPI002FC313AA
MTVDVYADIACPWCYVGRARLKQALARRPDLDVTLRWRPFQLQPNLPPEGRDFRSAIEEKFGDWARAKQMFERVREMGAAEGLAFDFDAIDVAPNTADAHRLVLWGQDQNAGDAVATALFRAIFSEGRNVTEPEVLVDCAADAGLDAEAARALLDGDEYAEAVRESQHRAQQRGITGVPCYVFGQEHAVMGAQSVEALTEALDAAPPTPSATE